MWLGVGPVVVSVSPSPKSQAYDATVPSLSPDAAASKLQTRNVQLVVNDAVGLALVRTTETGIDDRALGAFVVGHGQRDVAGAGGHEVVARGRAASPVPPSPKSQA